MTFVASHVGHLTSAYNNKHDDEDWQVEDGGNAPNDATCNSCQDTCGTDVAKTSPNHFGNNALLEVSQNTKEDGNKATERDGGEEEKSKETPHDNCGDMEAMRVRPSAHTPTEGRTVAFAPDPLESGCNGITSDDDGVLINITKSTGTCASSITALSVLHDDDDRNHDPNREQYVEPAMPVIPTQEELEAVYEQLRLQDRPPHDELARRYQLMLTTVAPTAPFYAEDVQLSYPSSAGTDASNKKVHFDENHQTRAPPVRRCRQSGRLIPSRASRRASLRLSKSSSAALIMASEANTDTDVDVDPKGNGEGKPADLEAAFDHNQAHMHSQGRGHQQTPVKEQRAYERDLSNEIVTHANDFRTGNIMKWTGRLLLTRKSAHHYQDHGNCKQGVLYKRGGEKKTVPSTPQTSCSSFGFAKSNKREERDDYLVEIIHVVSTKSDDISSAEKKHCRRLSIVVHILKRIFFPWYTQSLSSGSRRKSNHSVESSGRKSFVMSVMESEQVGSHSSNHNRPVLRRQYSV